MCVLELKGWGSQTTSFFISFLRGLGFHVSQGRSILRLGEEEKLSPGSRLFAFLFDKEESFFILALKLHIHKAF